MIVGSTTFITVASFIITFDFAFNILSPPYWAPSAVLPLPEMIFKAWWIQEMYFYPAILKCHDYYKKYPLPIFGSLCPRTKDLIAIWSAILTSGRLDFGMAAENLEITLFKCFRATVSLTIINFKNGNCLE